MLTTVHKKDTGVTSTTSEWHAAQQNHGTLRILKVPLNKAVSNSRKTLRPPRKLTEWDIAVSDEPLWPLM